MSELSLGGHAGKWSKPSPVYVDGAYHSDGMIWSGNLPMTEADRLALFSMLRRDYEPSAHTIYEGKSDIEMEALIKMDSASLVGRYDPSYSTYASAHSGHRAKGGIGSEVYQLQKVGRGVQFTKKKIWRTDAAGEMTKSIPPNCGAYHFKDMGDGYRDAHDGPAPGSKAEKMLGTGHYVWDAKHQWWTVVGGERKAGSRKNSKADNLRKKIARLQRELDRL